MALADKQHPGIAPQSLSSYLSRSNIPLQAAVRAQRTADEVFSNPAGVEQSKEAAQDLSDANAEVPKAIQKGFSDVSRRPRPLSHVCAPASLCLWPQLQGTSSAAAHQHAVTGAGTYELEWRSLLLCCSGSNHDQLDCGAQAPESMGLPAAFLTVGIQPFVSK